jgi:hypothetical protein
LLSDPKPAENQANADENEQAKDCGPPLGGTDV